MKKKISATTYSTIALVGIAACIGFLSSGWKDIWSLFYFILGILIFAAITILLTKLIPEVWVMVIVAVSVIIFLHVDIQSWLFTIIISCLAILLIFTHFKLHRSILSFSLFIIIIALYFYASEFGGFQQEVLVTDKDIQNTINEVQVEPDVISAYLSVEDDMVTCTLDVKDTVTKESARSLGEDCGMLFAKEVTGKNQPQHSVEDNLDVFYEEYKLTLMVRIGESDEILYGMSSSNGEKIIWSK